MFLIGIALFLLLLLWGFMVFPAAGISRLVMILSGLLLSGFSLFLCFRGLSVIGIPGFFFGIGILGSVFPSFRRIFNLGGRFSPGGSSMSVGDARDILGVGEDATVEEIQGAYRELMKRHHPDRSGGSSGYASLLNRARDILLRESRRGYWHKKD